VVVTPAQKSGTFTTTCACPYLITRIAYVPAHAFGRTQWRSYIRMVGVRGHHAHRSASMIFSDFKKSRGEVRSTGGLAPLTPFRKRT